MTNTAHQSLFQSPRPLRVAVALMIAALATLVASAPGAQSTTPSTPTAAIRVGSAAVRGKLPVFQAREPIVATLDVTTMKDGAPVLPADAAARVLEAARKRSLVLIEVRGLPLRFASLPPHADTLLTQATYEEGYSKQLAAMIRDVRTHQPGAVLGVIGLPLEGGASADAVNRSYAEALSVVTVMSPIGGILSSGVDAGSMVRSKFRASVSTADGRPIVFRGGTGWQIAMSAPPKSASTAPVVAGSQGASKSASPTSTATANDKAGVDAPAIMAAAGDIITVPQVLADWGSSENASDANGDGIVNGADLTLALAQNPNYDGSEPGGDGGPSDPLPPILQVGQGFTGVTPAPAPIGQPSDPGYGATVVVRWTDVPNQTVSTPTNVGVAAFHRNGIDRVEFSCNGGPWVAVSAMATNPQTGVCEYFCTVDPTGLSDGILEVRAIAYPKAAGKPRLLAGAFRADATSFPAGNGVYSMYLWSNMTGTFDRAPVYVSSTGSDTSGDGSDTNPYRTIARATKHLDLAYPNLDGCEIRCLPGTYSYVTDYGGWPLRRADNRWFTVTTAPNVKRADVTLTYGRPSQSLLCVRNCTLECTNGSFYVGFTNEKNLLWMDDCAVTMPGGRYAPNNQGFTISTCLAYATETVWNDVSNGPTYCILSRNCTTSILSENSHYQSQSVFNAVSDDLDAGATGYHPDVWQWYSPGIDVENLMVYGLRATNCVSQGLHIGANEANVLRDSAFVNVLIEHVLPDPQVTQIQVPLEHCLFLHLTMYHQSFFVRSLLNSDCTFIGNVFESVNFQAPGSPANLTLAKWEHNHFVNSNDNNTFTAGADYTTGPWSGIMESPATGNFTPIAGSSLLNRVAWGFVWTDAANQVRPSPSAVGAFDRP